MKLNLRTKILGGFLIINFLLIILAVVTYVDLAKMRASYIVIDQQVIPALGVVDEIKSEITSQANDERGFLLTGEDKFAEELLQRAENVDATVNRVKVNMDGEEKRFLDQIEQVHLEFTAIQKKVIETYKSGNKAEALRLSLEDGRAKRKSLEPIYAEMKKSIATDRTEADVDMETTLNMANKVIIGLASLAVAIGLFLGFFISGRIVSSVNSLLRLSNQIAAGDLSDHTVVIKTSDEIRDLADACYKMQTKIRELVTNILSATRQVNNTGLTVAKNAQETTEATELVARAISEIASGAASQANLVNNTMLTVNQVDTAIQQIAQGAMEQANNMGVTASMVGQMVQSIQDVATNAQTVANSAEMTRDAASKGERAVELTIQGMDGIKSKVFETASKVKELGEHSQQIGEIIQVISDIAEQTNLLALNAAIEAARAGEHGKGFAVVADEVRKLAERSGKATKQIAALINNIQKLTDSAVVAMETGTDEVEQGASLATDAGSALKEILGTVEETYRQIQNISLAAQNISDSSREVVAAIDNVSAIT
ncbi:MAG: methyl-accepting chemotaxis protein, partial [Carboxydocellales bacterium]